MCLEFTRGNVEFLSKFSISFQDFLIFHNTGEHFDSVEDDFNDCAMDLDSDYEANPGNLAQEFFDAPESLGAKWKIEVSKKSVAISPIHTSKETTYDRDVTTRLCLQSCKDQQILD